MSEQNRDDEYTDPTSPSPDPRWDQPSGSTPPPPPSEWQSPGYRPGPESDTRASDTPASDTPARDDAVGSDTADPGAGGSQDQSAPPVPPLSGTYGTPPPPPGSPYPPQGQAPYGSAPYGDPNAPYGAPPPGYYAQAPSQTNTSALVLTILSGIGIFACCGVTIVSLVLGILGLTKQATDPVQSAKLTKWGWIAFACGLVLAVVGFVLYVVGFVALAPELSEPGF
ncbi:MAG: hypothetical protein GX344_06345 [Intrasporangiaceae bacterium]|nr:hypothetical protein [Intrasporangiaceae bacterium]